MIEEWERFSWAGDLGWLTTILHYDGHMTEILSPD